MAEGAPEGRGYPQGGLALTSIDKRNRPRRFIQLGLFCIGRGCRLAAPVGDGDEDGDGGERDGEVAGVALQPFLIAGLALEIGRGLAANAAGQALVLRRLGGDETMKAKLMRA